MALRRMYFSFSEVYDSSDSLPGIIRQQKHLFLRRNNVGGNRDVEDYPALFRVEQPTSRVPPADNSWYNIVSASIDCYDPCKWKAGFWFHPVTPALSSFQIKTLPHLRTELCRICLCTLMMPGNATVYYNGHNFGTESQRTFPAGRPGRCARWYLWNAGLTTLVDLFAIGMATGNYRQDWLETNNYAFERQGSALVMLSSNTQAGYDSRTIDVTFASPARHCLNKLEMPTARSQIRTGNIPQLLIVNS